MLRFHTPGIPLTSSTNNILAGLDRIKELDLDGIEIEFTHGVKMSSELAFKVKDALLKYDLTSTIHGPFWINLNSKEDEKIEASKKRILDSVIKASELGAKSVTFHAAFMHEDSSDVVSSKVRDALLEILDETRRLDIDHILISPEVTGKETQFGSIEQLINLTNMLDNKIKFCIDFSHNYARTLGSENGSDAYERIITSIIANLGTEFLQNLHMHTGGILYGPKGETKHRPLDLEVEFEWKELFKVLKKYNVSGWITIETPDIEKSTKIARNFYYSL